SSMGEPASVTIFACVMAYTAAGWTACCEPERAGAQRLQIVKAKIANSFAAEIFLITPILTVHRRLAQTCLLRCRVSLRRKAASAYHPVWSPAFSLCQVFFRQAFSLPLFSPWPGGLASPFQALCARRCLYRDQRARVRQRSFFARPHKHSADRGC